MTRETRPLPPCDALRRHLFPLDLALVGAMLALVVLFVVGCGIGEDRIVVGSKNFTEQVILGELLALQIERDLGMIVERRLNLAGTLLCHEAVKSGEIDLYVEYTGTALAAILQRDPIRDREEAFESVKREYASQFELQWMPPLGFNNTFAIMVRGEDARQHGLTRISQAARLTPNWQAGFGYEFLERPDGFRGLSETYQLTFRSPPREMDLGLMYRALRGGQVDFIAGNSTDGLAEALDLVVLEDDRKYFPAYEAAAVVNGRTLERNPELRQSLEKLAGTITDEQMRLMNFQVDARGLGAREVARSFLESQGLELNSR